MPGPRTTVIVIWNGAELQRGLEMWPASGRDPERILGSRTDMCVLVPMLSDPGLFPVCGFPYFAVLVAGTTPIDVD